MISRTRSSGEESPLAPKEEAGRWSKVVELVRIAINDLLGGIISFMFGVVFAVSAAQTVGENLVPNCFASMVVCCVYHIGTRVPAVVCVPDVFIALFFASVKRKTGGSDVATFMVVSQIALGLTLAVFSRAKLLKVSDWLPSPVACGLLCGVGVCVALMALDVCEGKALVAAAGLAVAMRLREQNKVLILAVAWAVFPWVPGDMALRVDAPPVSLPKIDDARATLASITSAATTTTSTPSQSFPCLSDLASLVVVILLKESLTYSTLPRVIDAPVDAERELRWLGLATACVGVVGGVYCPPSASPMMVARGFGKLSHRGVPVVLLALALVGCRGCSVSLPSFVCGALMLQSGAKLAEKQLRQYERLPPSHFAIILLIGVAMPTLGLLVGVALGLGLALLLFAREYEAVGGVKYACAGLRSVVHRDLEPRDRPQYLQLHGYLFFGNAQPILTYARLVIPATRSLVVDFTFVTALDPSAAEVFDQLKALAASHACALRLCGVSAPVRRALRTDFDFYPDADRALEAAEEDNLRAESRTFSLAQCVGSEKLATALARVITSIELPKGHRIQNERVGDRVRSPLYLVSRGRVVVERDPDQSVATLASVTALQNPKKFRIADYGPGAIVGLEAMFLGYYTTATYVAATDCLLFSLHPNLIPDDVRVDVLTLFGAKLAKHLEHTVDHLALLRDAFL